MRGTNQIQKERQVSNAPALWQIEARVYPEGSNSGWQKVIWVIATNAERAMGCVRQTYSGKEPEFLNVTKRNKIGEILIDVEAAAELFQQFQEYKQEKEGDPFE